MSLCRFADELLGRLLQVVCPADLGELLDPEGGHVVVVAQLGRFVVPREHVVVVVPAFTHRHNGNAQILDRLNASV